MIVFPHEPKDKTDEREEKSEHAPTCRAAFLCGLRLRGSCGLNARFIPAVARRQRVIDALQEVVAVVRALIGHGERGRHFAVVEVEYRLDYAAAMGTFCKHANEFALEIEHDFPVHFHFAAKRTSGKGIVDFVFHDQAYAVIVSLKIHIYSSLFKDL